MAKSIKTVGCDKCGYYVEFESYDAASYFVDVNRHENPFNCDHDGIAVVTRGKDLDFRGE